MKVFSVVIALLMWVCFCSLFMSLGDLALKGEWSWALALTWVTAIPVLFSAAVCAAIWAADEVMYGS